MKRLCVFLILIAVTTAMAATSALACGWWGDGEGESSVDAVTVDAEGHRVVAKPASMTPQQLTQRATLLSRETASDAELAVAVKMLTEAAEKDFPPAQNNLAVLYEEGRGVPKSDQQAFKWFLKASEGGEPMAQHSLGVMYMAGRGIEANQSQAVHWLQESAKNRHPGAYCDLGDQYWRGAGVEKDLAEAVKWWVIGSGKEAHCKNALQQHLPQLEKEIVAEGRKRAMESGFLN